MLYLVIRCIAIKKVFYLSHPLILNGSNLTVGVPHHGYEQVDQEDSDKPNEDNKLNFANVVEYRLAVLHHLVHIIESSQGHDEHLHDALGTVLHGVAVLSCIENV